MLLAEHNEKNGRSEDNDLDLLANALIEKTNEVIRKLGVDTRKAHKPHDGSERFRRVSLAHDRLLQAQAAFTKPTIAIWRTVAGDDCSGDLLVQTVWELLKELERLGEGPAKQ